MAVPNGNEVVPRLNDAIRTVKQLGGRAVFTRDWHPTQTNHFDIWPVHCVAGTDGAAFHPDLLVGKNDRIIGKGTQVDEAAYSGFQGTTTDGKTLETIIREALQADHQVILALGGLATDYCVKATVLDALALQRQLPDQQLQVIALTDAMKAVNLQPDDGANALQAMVDAGATLVTTDQFIHKLETGELR